MKTLIRKERPEIHSRPQKEIGEPSEPAGATRTKRMTCLFVECGPFETNEHSSGQHPHESPIDQMRMEEQRSADEDGQWQPAACELRQRQSLVHCPGGGWRGF